MKFTPQRVKFLHSIEGVNYSLDFFFIESIENQKGAIAQILYSDIALLVLNGTSLSSSNALLALNQ